MKPIGSTVKTGNFRERFMNCPPAAQSHCNSRAYYPGTRCVCMLAALTVWTAAGMGCRQTAPVETPPPPMEHVMYVWQRQWTPDVVAAVEQSASLSDAYMVLAGEFESRDGNPRYAAARVDWKALAASQRTVWLVFRLWTGFLDRNGVPAFDPVPAFSETLALATDHGIVPAGLQVDYDSPTEDLAGYARFLAGLRTPFPDLPLAITALPDWLARHAFEDTVAGLDHFVLQVHSLDRPQDIRAPLVLCDTDSVIPWLEKALRLDTPCYIALPTYGYRAYFAPTGAFSGFRAEQAPVMPPGYRYRDVHADPVALAAVVRALHEKHMPGMRGIAWFRLPVEGDAFNWKWTTLKQVMRGEAPEARVNAAIHSPRKNLFELWVDSQGPWHPGTVGITLSWQGGRLEAADALNGFNLAPLHDDGHAVVVGQPTDSGEAILAAWCYVAPENDGQPVRMLPPKVEIQQ